MRDEAALKTCRHGACVAGLNRRAEPSWRIRCLKVRFASLFLVIMLGSALVGCSCSRRPEWDSGLQNRDRPARQTAGNASGGAAGGGQGSGEGSGAGDGSGAGSGGGGSEAGSGAGSGSAPNGTGKQGQGDDGSGPTGGSGTGSSDGSQSGNQPVASPGSGQAAGAGDAQDQPPAALPGRPRPKPLYDADTASEVAERHLRRAAVSQGQGDLGSAYDAALEAFEAVEPHAANDEACKAVLARAKRMLTDLAERQNRQTPPRAVPTLFE